jgi:ABC-2 type transport system ATP-binding protein
LNEEASATGKTFLISSHDLQHITDVCDRIVVLNKGKIVRDVVTSSKTLNELEAFFQEQL